MVGDRIGAADFELDPKSFLPIIACKQYVSACSVTEHALPLVIEDVSFTSASPSRRTGSRETLLEKSGQASHLTPLQGHSTLDQSVGDAKFPYRFVELKFTKISFGVGTGSVQTVRENTVAKDFNSSNQKLAVSGTMAS